VVDTTPPAIQLISRLPAANSFGWNKESVVLTWSCTDIVDGKSEISSTVSGEAKGQSATGTCTDKAGNSNLNTVSDINIDLTLPSLTWNGGPANGGVYYFGFVPAAATCTEADALSGGNGCNVSGYDASIGSHTLTAVALDKAGNEYSETRTYTVNAWTLKGFYQPVDMNGVINKAKLGSTIPLKFEIFAGSTELTDTAYVKSLTFVLDSAPAGTLTDDIESYATGGTSLRYDSVAGQFIFNWKTSSPMVVGKVYRVTLTTLDGSKLVAFVQPK
jgi:hypothetical protein